jgi:kynurenine formamidase
MRLRLLAIALFSFISSPVIALELDAYQLVDLSHTYNSDTLYWPTSPSAFEKTELNFGEVEGGYFYSAYTVCTPEHGGTHLDAPIHFAKEGASTEEIPLENLIAPAIVIDVSKQAAADRNYRLSVADVRKFEAQHGEIARGTIVLLRTGWSQYWPDAQGYLGDDKPGDASNLEFPGYGADAVRLLAEERNVAVLGVDSASIDYGPSQDFIAHRIAAAAGVVNLENLTNLDLLPVTGATILALPMKIGGGSGGPARVVALVPK